MGVVGKVISILYLPAYLHPRLNGMYGKMQPNSKLDDLESENLGFCLEI